jgi:hypothetical protein
MHPLDKVRLKLDWAQEHLTALNRELGDFLDLKPYRIDPEPPSPPRESGKHVIGTYRIAHEPPVRLSLILGDYVHNLRSTLDHLFWQLLINPRPNERSQFPIFWDRSPGSLGRLDGELAKVRPEVGAVIKDLQPYQRWPAYRQHKLWIISRLDNIDKHATPIVTVLSEALVAVWPGNRIVNMLTSPLNDGDPVYIDSGSTLAGHGPATEDKPYVNVEPTYGVVLEEAPYASIPLSEMGQLHLFVDHAVLPRFAGFFK